MQEPREAEFRREMAVRKTRHYRQKVVFEFIAGVIGLLGIIAVLLAFVAMF